MNTLKVIIINIVLILAWGQLFSQSNTSKIINAYDDAKAQEYFKNYKNLRTDKGENKTWSIKNGSLWIIPKYILSISPDSINTPDDFMNKLNVAPHPNHAFILNNGKYYGTESVDFVLNGITACNRFDKDNYGIIEVSLLKNLKADFIFQVENLYGFFFIKNDTIKVADIVNLKIYNFYQYFLEKHFAEYDKIESSLIKNKETVKVKKDNYFFIINKMTKVVSGFFGISSYKVWVLYPRDPLTRPYIRLYDKDVDYIIPKNK